MQGEDCVLSHRRLVVRLATHTTWLCSLPLQSFLIPGAVATTPHAQCEPPGEGRPPATPRIPCSLAAPMSRKPLARLLAAPGGK